MARIRKIKVVNTYLSVKSLALQAGDHLVDWLNSAMSGSPADREAAKRVGGVIDRMNRGAVAYLERNIAALDDDDDIVPVPELRDFAPFYTFEFKLFPPARSGQWQLHLRCTDTSLTEQENRTSFELGAMNTVVEIALGGRLGRIRQCQIPGCGKWDVTKNDKRVYRCKECSLHDHRKRTAERKKQLSAAQKNVREREKRDEDQSWKYVGKKKDDK